MAEIKGTVAQAPMQAVNEGASIELSFLRTGAMLQSDWKQAAILAGYGYMVNVGAFSTGIVGGGADSVIDIDEPEGVISVPNGRCILPLRVGLYVQSGAPADGEEVELLIAVDQDKAYDSTGTVTSETIYNMNTLCGASSSCTAVSACTDSMTDPVLDLELARKVIEYDGGASHITAIVGFDLVYEPKNPPIINGPAMLCVYWGGDTGTVGGFADIQWLEFPESAFSV